MSALYLFFSSNLSKSYQNICFIGISYFYKNKNISARVVDLHLALFVCHY